MRWCNIQTNENHLQTNTYPIICTHHKLHNDNENKFPVFPECMWNKWQNMAWQTSQAHNHEKYNNNGKGGYFRFDDDNNMSYRYILSITYTEMGQLNTYSPIYCN